MEKSFPKGVVVNYIADDGKSVIDYDHFNFETNKDWLAWVIKEFRTIPKETSTEPLFVDWATAACNPANYKDDATFLVFGSQPFEGFRYFAIYNNPAYSFEENYQVNFDELGNVYIDQDKD